MRAFKFVLGAIVLIFMAIVVYQNPHVFWEKKSLQINLGAWRDQSPDLALSIYFLTFFLVGFLISYFISLIERFRTKKLVTIQQQTIQRLEQEVQTLKSPSSEEPESSIVENDESVET
jgi:uncharacterized integral membrane protein